MVTFGRQTFTRTSQVSVYWCNSFYQYGNDYNVLNLTLSNGYQALITITNVSYDDNKVIYSNPISMYNSFLNGNNSDSAYETILKMNYL